MFYKLQIQLNSLSNFSKSFKQPPFFSGLVVKLIQRLSLLSKCAALKSQHLLDALSVRASRLTFAPSSSPLESVERSAKVWTKSSAEEAGAFLRIIVAVVFVAISIRTRMRTSSTSAVTRSSIGLIRSLSKSASKCNMRPSVGASEEVSKKLFERIEADSPYGSVSVANSPRNHSLNRWCNVLPFDNSR